MKVLFINSVYGRGSTGRIVAELGKAVENNGGEYKVAYGRGTQSNDPRAFFIGGKSNYYSHALLARLTDKTGFYSTRATKKLIQFIKSYQPDIIHLHNLHGYYLNVEVLFKYLKEEYKGKIIWTLHDCWAFTGHCPHYSFVKCDKWQTQCFNCPEKKRYPSSCFKDNSYKNYLRKKSAFCGLDNLTIVTVSEWLKRQVEQSFLKEYTVKRIYNGIDCDKFSPKESDFKKRYDIKGKMLLSVSDGWDRRKGWDRLLSVAKISPKDWKFVVVGVEGKTIRKLPDNVIGFQRIWEQQELIKMYSAADVFFNPSVEETFGLVTAEAMACGTPALVMNSTACPEVVCESNAGSVVECSTTDEEMVELLSETMSKNAPRECVLNNFTLQKQTKAYMALFNNEENI